MKNSVFSTKNSSLSSLFRGKFQIKLQPKFISKTFLFNNAFKMSQNKTSENKKSFSVDWLMRGSLTKFGDIFDRLTGRGWKPSSSLATSELIEKLKSLLDSEAKDLGKKGKFVPHNLKLKIQWDKFSIDSDTAMQKLEHELLTAIIDHINDQRYHTYAPLKLQVKPDYFTEGVRLLASFDKFSEEEGEAAVSVTVPQLKNIVIPTAPEVKIEKEKEIVIAEFTTQNKPKRVALAFAEGSRLSVGRTKENALIIEDTSISKIHATLFINSEKTLMVADTGSTNGTFINDKRIAYGKAIPLSDADKVKFGTIEVALEYVPKEIPVEPQPEPLLQTQSSLPTEQLIMKDGNLESLEKTISVEPAKTLPPTAIVVKPIIDKALAETALPKTMIDLKPLQAKPVIAPIEKVEAKSLPNIAEIPLAKVLEKDDKAEENPNSTAQGIVFDFGEDK